MRPFTRDWIPESQAIADAAAALGIFVVALIILTVINQLIASRVQRSRLGALDRTLGFIFGAVRGAVLVCLAYLLFVWAVEPPDRPPWVDEAKTMPYIKRGSAAIREVVPEEVQAAGAEATKDTADSVRDLRVLTEPVAPEPAPDGETGYGRRERKGLESLSESVGE